MTKWEFIALGLENVRASVLLAVAALACHEQDLNGTQSSLNMVALDSGPLCSVPAFNALLRCKRERFLILQIFVCLLYECNRAI